MLKKGEFVELTEHRPLRLLLLSARQWRMASGRALQDLGLTVALIPYLMSLYWKDGQTQRELSDLTLQDPATTVRAVDRLQALGFVERRRSASDRRIWQVYLTPRGEEIRGEVNSRLDQVEKSALEGLSAREMKILRGCLMRVIENIGGCEAFLRGNGK